MRVSRNELEVRYARAFEAMGFPAGLASDAAAIVAWEDMRGLAGLDRLAGRLARLDGARLPPLSVQGAPGDQVMAAKGTTLLAAGPLALDLLDAALARQATARLCVTDVEDLDFAAGLAGLAQARGLPTRIHAVLGETALLATSAAAGVRLTWGAPARLAEGCGEGVFLLAGAVDDGGEAWPRHGTAGLDAETLAARAAAALDEGVAVDPAPWRRVHALGARFLVPESAQSRAAGAGGGNDND